MSKKVVTPEVTKFKREWKDDDNVTTIWHYNLKVTKNGPVLVEFVYPPGYFGEKVKKSRKQK